MQSSELFSYVHIKSDFLEDIAQIELQYVLLHCAEQIHVKMFPFPMMSSCMFTVVCG